MQTKYIKAYIKNLYDHIGHEGEHPTAYCTKCGMQYSANKGDYWNRSDDDALKCCNKICLLVYPRKIYFNAPMV